MLVPLVLIHAFVVMMLMPTFTLRSLMIVAVGHLRPTTITVHFAAKRLLGVLALATALGTAVSRRSHGAISRATTAATASTTTPSTASATRLAGAVSTVATARSITATILTFYASITRATRQRRC